MTDIVGSTDLAARVGDAAWDQLLERHNVRIREIFERHRGVEIDTTGDGFLAIFDGAARAVQAAAEARSACRSIGVDIRVAVHTGEVEMVPGTIRGLAVHETARILGLAPGPDVLVSSATHGLIEGSGFEFEHRGTHRLKGVPGERTVYALVTGG